MLFPCDIFLRPSSGKAVFECRKTQLCFCFGVEHTEVVAPSGARDDVIGPERDSGLQKQCIAFDAMYVVTDDF